MSSDFRRMAQRRLPRCRRLWVEPSPALPEHPQTQRHDYHAQQHLRDGKVFLDEGPRGGDQLVEGDEDHDPDHRDPAEKPRVILISRGPGLRTTRPRRLLRVMASPAPAVRARARRKLLSIRFSLKSYPVYMLPKGSPSHPGPRTPLSHTLSQRNGPSILKKVMPPAPDERQSRRGPPEDGPAAAGAPGQPAEFPFSGRSQCR